MSNNLENAFTALRNNDCAIPANLAESMAQLENPHYRIAVIGKFQVGKSTLINRVFLGADSLPTENGTAQAPAASSGMDELDAFMSSPKPALIEGNGICTTSVATEICHGEQPTLEVYPWKVRTDMTDTLEGEKPVSIREEPGTPDITVQPTPENLRNATTASSSDARLEKAQSTALVRLLWPEPALERYTLIDTPGIDDPIPEIVNTTTYRVLPGADTAILVLEPKALDQPVLDFLRSRVFEAGLVRILALVSYNPEAKKLGSGARDGILSAIRAQLSGIGRDSIPVEMYCFDSSVDGAIHNSPERIRARLLGYLDQNVDAARRDKTAHLLRAALRNELLRLRTAEAALKKSENERREIARKIEAKMKECDVEFESFIDDILDGLDEIRNSARLKLKRDFSEVVERHAKSLDDAQSFSEVKQKIEDMKVNIQNDVEQCLFDIGIQVKKEMKKLVTSYGDKARLVSAPVRDALRAELELDGGILTRIPDILMTIVDFILTFLIIPGPFFTDLIVRYFAEKSETLKKFLPTNIVIGFLAGQVKKKINCQRDEIISMVDKKFGEQFESAKKSTRKAMEEAREEELDSIRAGLNVNSGIDSLAEAKRVAASRTELEQALLGLENN